MASDRDFLFQAYSVSVMVLLVLYFVAQMSAIDPNDHMKEDATLLADAVTQYEAKPEEDKKRKKRIFLNSHENIPFHSALLTGAVFVVSIKDASLDSFGINAPIPFRSLSFVFSMLTMFGALGVSIAAAFN